MLIRREVLEQIASGEVDLAFRRWRRPSVKSGGRLRTAIGTLAIDAVDEIDEAAIANDDARRAGYATRDDLLADLDSGRGGTLYRIRLRLAGPDSRVELRERGELDATEGAELARRLARLDAASPSGPWTNTVLRLIEARPSVRASDLAASLGLERLVFKRNVRKLKELGLTESLEVGYRLSPRGRAFLERHSRH
jgi:hypothetical protein